MLQSLMSWRILFEPSGGSSLRNDCSTRRVLSLSSEGEYWASTSPTSRTRLASEGADDRTELEVERAGCAMLPEVVSV